jgi:hypothetical protein
MPRPHRGKSATPSQRAEDGLLPSYLREAFAVFNPRVESGMVARGGDVPTVAAPITPAGPTGHASENDNVVVRWNVAALQGVRDSHIGPPMVARALAIVHTCIFDAWAVYDKRAMGTQFGDKLRRPKRERTFANRMKLSALLPIARWSTSLRLTKLVSLIHSWRVWATIRTI